MSDDTSIVITAYATNDPAAPGRWMVWQQVLNPAAKELKQTPLAADLTLEAAARIVAERNAAQWGEGAD